jgi:hypothetical protein
MIQNGSERVEALILRIDLCIDYTRNKSFQRTSWSKCFRSYKSIRNKRGLHRLLLVQAATGSSGKARKNVAGGSFFIRVRGLRTGEWRNGDLLQQ